MSQSVSRRTFLKLAGVSAASAAFAACGPQAPQAPPAPAAATTAPEATTAPQAAATTAPAGEMKKLIFSSYTWSGYEAAMRSIIDSWVKDHPDVQVEQQYIAEDYWTKLQTQVAGGTPPDVGISDYGRMLPYAKSGILLPISELIARDNFPLDKMLPGAVAQYRWVKGEFDSGGEGGEMYGLPSDAQDQIFAYNKKMFDDAGVKYPTDDWTWDDVVTAGKTITNADQNKWGIQRIDPWIMTKGNFLFSAGGANHTADLKKSLVDDPKSVEAWKWDWDLIYTHKIAPPPGAQAQTNPFMSGQVAMVVDGVWWISDFASITDFGWDIALQPKHPQTGKRTTSVESDGWWIFKATKYVDDSWSLMQNLSDEAGQKRFGDAGYVIPSCFPDIGKEWYSKPPPENRMKALDNIVQDSTKVDYTYFEFFTCWDAYRPPIEAAFADGTDIEAALTEAATIHNEELAKAWDKFQAA
jgi:multiple sugar transport system substrate-binding protein